jgi:hypothetical protein
VDDIARSAIGGRGITADRSPSSRPRSNCGAWLPAFRRRLGPERRVS